jgi:hypothetical protein
MYLKDIENATTDIGTGFNTVTLNIPNNPTISQQEVITTYGGN